MLNAEAISITKGRWRMMLTKNRSSLPPVWWIRGRPTLLKVRAATRSSSSDFFFVRSACKECQALAESIWVENCMNDARRDVAYTKVRFSDLVPVSPRKANSRLLCSCTKAVEFSPGSTRNSCTLRLRVGATRKPTVMTKMAKSLWMIYQ